MPPVIVIIATVIAANIGLGAYLAVVLYLINYIAADYNRNLQENKSVDPADDRRLVGRGSSSPLIRLYGERRISGTLVYWATGGDETIAPKKSLILVICLAEQEFESIEEIYLADKLSTDISIPAEDNFEIFLGLNSQTVSSIIQEYNSNGEPWDNNHRGDGIAYVVVQLNSYEDWEKIPDISVIAKGAKVYDPRKDSTNGGSGSHRYTDDATWEYSTNPALLARDYLTHEVGFNEVHTKIDDAVTIVSANYCDILVLIPESLESTGINFTLPNFINSIGSLFPLLEKGDIIRVTNSGSNDGDYEVFADTTTGLIQVVEQTIVTEAAGPLVKVQPLQKRYFCDIALSLAKSKRYNLLQILETMYGEVVYVGGIWKIMAGQFTTPTITIVEDDIVEGLTISSGLSASSLYNEVTGTYYDKDRFYQKVTFENRSNGGYVTRDGGRKVVRDINLVGVTNEYQAQRLATFELNRSEHQTVISLTVVPKHMDLHVNMLVKLTLDNPNWTDKPFRILSWELQSDLSIKLVLRDENSGAWDDPLTIYDTVQSGSQYNPYIPRIVEVPLLAKYFSGIKAQVDLVGGASYARAMITWEHSVHDQLRGYKIKWRPISNANNMSDGIIEITPSFYFKGDETSGTNAVDDAIYSVVGTYGIDANTAGMSVAGLDPFESGTAIFIGGLSNRVIAVVSEDTQYPVDEFSVIILFKVGTAVSDTTIIGQWGATNALKAFRFGTLTGSANIGVSMYDNSGTPVLYEGDSGSDYNDASSHIAIIRKKDNNLTLKIDNVLVSTIDLTGVTMNFSSAEDFTVGGGSSGTAFNGTWDNAVMVNRFITDYEEDNLYSLWSTGDIATGGVAAWNEKFVGPTEREWFQELVVNRYYDFSLQAFSVHRIHSDEVLFLGKQVFGNEIAIAAPQSLTAEILSFSINLSLDITNITDNDLAYVEWIWGTANDRDDLSVGTKNTNLSGSGGYPDPNSPQIDRVVVEIFSPVGIVYYWARLVNNSGGLGAWTSAVNNGLKVTANTAFDGSNNIIPAGGRSLDLVEEPYILTREPGSDGSGVIDLTEFGFTEGIGELISFSVQFRTSYADTFVTRIGFRDSGGSTVGANFILNNDPINTWNTMILEGIQLPFAAIQIEVQIYLQSDPGGELIDFRNAILVRGNKAIVSSPSWGDRYLDPEDSEVYLIHGDGQNLLDGQTEIQIDDSPTGTGAKGGPIDDPANTNGGWYDVKREVQP